MTKQGFDAIQAEIDFLWKDERPRIVAEVSYAAEMGDRSENAEYIYGKKRLREIDGRMRYLRQKTAEVTVVDPDDQTPVAIVQFGAVVTIEDEDGEQRTFRLVDKEESDANKGRISVQSPVGRALMGRRVGDAFEIDLPRGRVAFELLALRYGGGEP